MKLINSHSKDVPIFLIGTKCDCSQLIEIKKIKAFRKKYNMILRTFFISIILGFRKQKIYEPLVETLLLANRSVERNCFYNSILRNQLNSTARPSSNISPRSVSQLPHGIQPFIDCSSCILQFCIREPSSDQGLPSLPNSPSSDEDRTRENSMQLFLSNPIETATSERGEAIENLREEMLEELERLRDIMLGGDIYDDPRFENLSDKEKDIFKKFINYFSTCPVCGKENHKIYLKNFYFSEELEEMRLKKTLIHLIRHEKEFSQLNFHNLKLGIPCCDCFKHIFAEF
jgi:hypothetical protein